VAELGQIHFRGRGDVGVCTSFTLRWVAHADFLFSFIFRCGRNSAGKK
jgi:hypothetical protein